MVSTADISGARHKKLDQGECLGLKQAQLIAMHCQDFLEDGRKIKGLVVYLTNGVFTLLTNGLFTLLTNGLFTLQLYECVTRCVEATPSPYQFTVGKTNFALYTHKKKVPALHYFLKMKLFYNYI